MSFRIRCLFAYAFLKREDNDDGEDSRDVAAIDDDNIM